MKFNRFVDIVLPKLQKGLAEFNEELVANNLCKGMENEVKHFVKLNQGGKMLRGILVVLGYFAGKGFEGAQLENGSQCVDYAIKLALAVEIFQTSVLMQDDVIDEDSIRRGVQTLHSKILQETGGNSNAIHYANSLAMIFGSIGVLKASELIFKEYAQDSNAVDIFNLFNSMLLETYTGEFLDIKLSHEDKHIGLMRGEGLKETVLNFISSDLDASNMVEAIIQMYQMKTVDYTIFSPLRLGFALAGKKLEEEGLRSFATYLGTAFQIQDDFLGIFGQMDKEGCSDIKEGKRTLMFACVQKDEKNYAELMKYYGKRDAGEKELCEVRRIFEKCGAKNETQQLVRALYSKASERAKELDFITSDCKDIFYGLIEYLQAREK